MKGLDLLAGAVSRQPDISIWSWAKVTDDSPLRLQLDGESAPLDVTPDTLVGGLNVNDRVWVQLVTNANPARRHRRVVVLGKAAGLPTDAVTNAQLANMATQTFKGRNTAGTGAPEDLSIATARTMLGMARMGCSIRRVATQSIPNAGAGSSYISFDTEDADTNSMFAPTSTTVTLPATAIWAVTVRTTWGSLLGGTARTFLALELNGSTNDVYRLPVVPLSENFVGASWTLPFTSGDTFKIQVYQSSGAANNLTAELHCYRVSV